MVETVEEELRSLSERKVCFPKLDIASGALSCSKTKCSFANVGMNYCIAILFLRPVCERARPHMTNHCVSFT